VIVHGAFKGGDKAMVGAKVQPLLDGGFAVASVNYRLSGEATFPAGAQDVKAAVRWLRANAATYSIDPDRFAAWGESAGGNLVALLGTTSDQATVLDDPELGNVSSGVQAVTGSGRPTSPRWMRRPREGGAPAPAAHPAIRRSLWVGGGADAGLGRAGQSDHLVAARGFNVLNCVRGADCNVPFRNRSCSPALTAAGRMRRHRSAERRQFDGTLLQPTVAWLATVLAADRCIPASVDRPALGRNSVRVRRTDRATFVAWEMERSAQAGSCLVWFFSVCRDRSHRVEDRPDFSPDRAADRRPATAPVGVTQTEEPSVVVQMWRRSAALPSVATVPAKMLAVERQSVRTATARRGPCR
jgi:hypothetical protein